MFKCVKALWVLVCLLATSPTMAQLEWELSAGASLPSDSHYESDVFASTALGYGAGRWAGRAGYMDLGEFELDSTRTDARIAMAGPFAQVVQRFDARLVTWELGLGAARLESEARLGGRLLETKTEWDPFLELALSQAVASGVALKGSYLYFSDRLGSDVSALSVGVRLSF